MNGFMHSGRGRAFVARASLLVLAALAFVQPCAHAQSVPGGKPELRVAALSLSRSVAHLGETVEATVTIENLGDVGVTNVTVRFYLGTRRIGQDFLVDVGPHARVDVTTAFVAKPEGKQEFLVHVDPDDQVAEGDEFNNLATRTLGILSLPSELEHERTARPVAPEPAAPARADLSVQRVTADPLEVQVGEKVRLEAFVHNAGERPVEDVTVRFIAGTVPLGTDRRISLAGNQDERVSMVYAPSSAGEVRVAALVNPDRRVEESTYDNNQQAVTVRVTAPPPPPQPAPGPVAAKRTGTDLPNLVCTVETIDGVHYFDGRNIKVKLRNSSKTARARPFMLGIRRAGAANAGWLTTLPVQALAPGEEITLHVPWPTHEAPLGPEHAYVAVADIDNDVRETGSARDNASVPFSLVAIGGEPASAAASPGPAPELAVTGPAPRTVLVPGKTYELRWRSAGEVGDKVDLVLADKGGERRLIVAGTDNSGQYAWRAPELADGQWWVEVRTADGTTSGRGGPYVVKRPAAVLAEFTAPTIGSRVYVDDTLGVTWRAQGAAAGTRGRLSVISADTGERHPVLKGVEVDLSSGRYDWRVPATPFAFGQFRLRLEDEQGRKLADSAVFELLPAFVDRAPPYNPADVEQRIQADLAVSEAKFDGPFLTFTITNLGPQELSGDLVAGLRFKVYFVRHSPPRNASDIGVCERSEFAPLAKGDSLSVDIGRDPDCAFGERSNDQRFAYAIIRIGEPVVLDRLWVDPAPLNNSRRLDWPKN